MIETAIQVTDRRIPAADLEVILGWGQKMLGAPTELLDGVEEALQTVSSQHQLLLITKGTYGTPSWIPRDMREAPDHIYDPERKGCGYSASCRLSMAWWTVRAEAWWSRTGCTSSTFPIPSRQQREKRCSLPRTPRVAAAVLKQVFVPS
jgi:hypothetical protein